MRLYIWEGDGISEAYHDDGTLVVLAESPEQARAVARRQRAGQAERDERWGAALRELRASMGVPFERLYASPEFRALRASFGGDPGDVRVWDGADSALDREPDRIVPLDAPCVVAFNGGGYD